MSAISLKSITGITSITTPAGVDNQLTLHTNNTAERFRIDSSGRLLIGTTTEGHGNADDLTIATTDHTGITLRSATNRNGSVFFSDGTSGADEYRGWIQYTHTSDYLTFGTAANERLRITSGGSIGIGLANPQAQYFNNLVVGNNDAGDKGITIRSNSGSSGILAFSDTDAADANRYDGYIRYSHADQHMSFYTAGGNKRFTINEFGFVGVNTTQHSINGMSRYLSVSARNVNNGGSAVEIVGNRTGGDQTLGVINFVNNTSNVAQITAKYQGSTTNGSLQFFTSGDERLRITSGGLVGIGTISPNLVGNGNGLHIHDTGGAAELHLTTTASGKSSTDGFAIQMTGSVANLVNRETGYTRFYVGGGGGTNEKLRINNSGLVEIKNFSGVGLHLQGGSDTTLRISDTDGTNQRVDLAHNGGESYIVTRNNTNHGSFRLYSQNGSETLTRLRITSGGNIGVGTVSPDDPLHIYHATDNFIGRFESGDAGGGIVLKDPTHSTTLITNDGDFTINVDNGSDVTGETIRFEISGSEKLRITSTGLIRMGNGAEANTEAHITAAIFQNTTGAATILKLGNTNTPSSANNRAIEFCDGTGGTEGSSKYTYARIKAERAGGSNNGRLIFYTKPNNNDGPSERLRITSTGDLSLRSTTQNAFLGLTANSTAINFTLGSTDGASPRMYFYGTGNGQSSAGDIFTGTGTGGILHYRSGGLIKFEVNSDNSTTEALRIDSAGNAQFGGVTHSGPWVHDGGSSNGARQIIDFGSGTANRCFGWGGTTANYANIWTEYSSGDLNFAAGLRPNGTSQGYVSSFGGSSIGRAGMELTLSGNVIFRTAASSTVANGTAVSTLTERLVITSGGGIGVGNASPTTWGTGIPTIEFKGTSGSHTSRAGAIGFESQSGSNGYNLIYSESGDLIFYSGATNRASATTERLRIKRGGLLTIPGISPTRDPQNNTAAAVVNTSGRQLESGNDFQTNGKSNLSVGWYTIAVTGSGRASARFGIKEAASSRHQAVTFYAGHHFGGSGGQNCIHTIFHGGTHGNVPLGELRIKASGVYDGAMLQVYIRDSTNNVQAYLLGDNIQTEGWRMVDWIADGTDPGGLGNFSAIQNTPYFPAKANLVPISGGGASLEHTIPGITNNFDLGTAALQWRDVYCAQGAFNNSDENLKQNILELTSAEMNAAKRISKLFRTYKWKTSVAEKGDNARIHTGTIAQQIQAAMSAEGLDATNYGFLGINEWYEDSEGTKLPADEPTIQGDTVDFDDPTNPTPNGKIVVPEGFNKVTRYSVRYTELLSFIAAYNEQRFTSIESRLAALESS